MDGWLVGVMDGNKECHGFESRDSVRMWGE